MSHTRPILSLSCLTVALAFALAACGTQAPPKADTPSQEQRLFDLERRMERLEARPAVPSALPKQGGDPGTHQSP